MTPEQIKSDRELIEDARHWDNVDGCINACFNRWSAALDEVERRGRILKANEKQYLQKAAELRAENERLKKQLIPPVEGAKPGWIFPNKQVEPFKIEL